ncbi:hypothetical protein Glove_349g108 [Diversispora epigaea]|uniref:Uncharacterized protein n=1 Tax=Diversispora epigaea TaxID=1348612 RepID=A0A397HDM9_9GLOM|nr:hypothetical protein Glove_349g108 [Diversispora epigaea]
MLLSKFLFLDNLQNSNMIIMLFPGNDHSAMWPFEGEAFHKWVDGLFYRVDHIGYVASFTHIACETSHPTTTMWLPPFSGLIIIADNGLSTYSRRMAFGFCHFCSAYTPTLQLHSLLSWMCGNNFTRSVHGISGSNMWGEGIENLIITKDQPAFRITTIKSSNVKNEASWFIKCPDGAWKGIDDCEVEHISRSSIRILKVLKAFMAQLIITILVGIYSICVLRSIENVDCNISTAWWLPGIKFEPFKEEIGEFERELLTYTIQTSSENTISNDYLLCLYVEWKRGTKSNDCSCNIVPEFLVDLSVNRNKIELPQYHFKCMNREIRGVHPLWLTYLDDDDNKLKCSRCKDGKTPHGYGYDCGQKNHNDLSYYNSSDSRIDKIDRIVVNFFVVAAGNSRIVVVVVVVVDVDVVDGSNGSTHYNHDGLLE